MTPIEAIRRTLEDSEHLRHLSDREKDVLAASIAIAVSNAEVHELFAERQAAVRRFTAGVSTALEAVEEVMRVVATKRGPVRGISRTWSDGEAPDA